MSKSLDCCYMRMLQMVFNISWMEHVNNETLYGDLPKLTSKIAALWLSLASRSP